MCRRNVLQKEQFDFSEETCESRKNILQLYWITSEDVDYLARTTFEIYVTFFFYELPTITEFRTEKCTEYKKRAMCFLE